MLLLLTSRFIEISRGALATPAVNKQYAELLPNATGEAAQPAADRQQRTGPAIPEVLLMQSNTSGCVILQEHAAQLYVTLHTSSIASSHLSQGYHPCADLCACVLAGNYCQDVQLQKGARYRLSYFYGRLMTLTEG
jgi:hypothetical protein